MTLSMYCAGNPANPLIVLAHGVSDSALGWVELIKHLAQKYYVVAVDHIGHGISPRVTNEAAPFDEAVDAFYETLTRLTDEHGKAVLIGHSMGGAISTLTAEKYPEKVAGLVLEDPAFMDERLQKFFIDKVPDELKVTEFWATEPEQAITQNKDRRPGWTVCEHVAWEFAKAALDPVFIKAGVVTFTEPWDKVANRIAVPTLLVTSDTPEVLIGKAGAERITNPKVRVEIIPNAAHSVRRDKPAEFEALLDGFLTDINYPGGDHQ